MKTRIPVSAIYPFLFALAPLVNVYNEYFPQYPIRDTYRSIAFAAAGTLLLVLFWRLVLRSWEKAGLVSTFFLILFSSYGSALQLISNRFPGSLFSRVNVLMAVWVSVLIVGTWALIRILRQTTLLTRLFTAMGILLILFNIAEISYKALAQTKIASTPVVHAEAGNPTDVVKAADNPPDVYYIILDGYGRSDVLKEIFQLDNSSLITYLQQKGFYIGSQSYSNYAQTILSIMSSLNIQYIDQFVPFRNDSSGDYDLNPYLQHNYVMEFFKQRGYTTCAFDPGFSIQVRNVDVFIPRNVQLNVFELLASRNTMGVIFDEALGRELYAIDTRNELENLKTIIDDPGPKFVFAHILNPHPPFVMAHDGTVLRDMPFSYEDASEFPGSDEAYSLGYSEQVKFLENQIRDVVDRILAKPGARPIIIIQGDHGSRKYTETLSYEQSCMHEGFSILNAYYFPDGDYTRLTPDITPVNSFRVVMDQYFNADFPLLEDRYIFSTNSYPRKFVEVNAAQLAEPCQVK